MKQTRRTRQVGEMIRDEIADMLRREIRDPDLGFVTIAGVQVSTDLRLARIFVSVLGDDEARQKSLAVLERSRGHLRRILGSRIRLRLVPNLEFIIDNTAEHASRIESILMEVLPKQNPDVADDDDAGEEGSDE